MTRYAGSRASGYPPDPVPFRRCAVAHADSGRAKRGRFRAASPSTSRGSCSGGRHGVGRDSRQVTTVLSRFTPSSQQAAPTRATLRPQSSRHPAVLVQPLFSHQRARSWAIERIKILPATRPPNRAESKNGSTKPYKATASLNGLTEPFLQRRTTFFFRHSTLLSLKLIPIQSSLQIKVYTCIIRLYAF